MDMLRREGAPPGLQGANPGLHAGNVDGCRRVGEIRVVGVQRVGDERVLLQGSFEYPGRGCPPPYAHPAGRGREAVEQYRQQWIARSASNGMVELPVELDVFAGL